MAEKRFNDMTPAEHRAEAKRLRTAASAEPDAIKSEALMNSATQHARAAQKQVHKGRKAKALRDRVQEYFNE